MNHPELEHYGKADQSFNDNKTTLIIHCKGCGKFKDKKSLSTLCTVCLFHMTTEKAIERGYIHA